MFSEIAGRYAGILCVLLALIVGCDKNTSLPNAPPARPALMGTSTIIGKVFIEGEVPEPQILSEAGACHPGSPAILDEAIVTNPNRTLRGVIVYLADVPRAAYAPGATLYLDQRDCQYVPHVLALQTGQKIIVRNNDGQFHNVDFQCQINQPLNQSMMGDSELDPIAFAAPEFFKITCDVHAWMSAQVGVFDHPFFAVTGDDGSYAIKQVPAGNFKLMARHERLGSLSQPVQIGADQHSSINFTYK